MWTSRRRLTNATLAIAGVGLLALQFHAAAQTQTRLAKDPGPRGGASGAGGPLPNLSEPEKEYFYAAQAEFTAEEGVEEGLGPRMNLDSCSGCHLHPEVGGSSPPQNPQVAFATKIGGIDDLPPFITLKGPVRETRFVRNADGTPDGGVHALFTISNRAGASGCMLKQPDYAGEIAKNNVVFRIPTPTFGGGLIEAIPDSAIVANANKNSNAKSLLGVRGRPNFSLAGLTITGQTNNNGNDGTIARFGWKAQNKSLLVFSGEAYNVEMGISNEVFQTEREEYAACQFAAVPNDTTNMAAGTAFDGLSDVEKFAIFMRLLGAPVPSATTPGGSMSITNGAKVFNDVGCALCHTPSMMTGNASVAALRNQTVNLYSDLLVHDMGVGLADGVSQAQAGPREFRSAPLWGLGQRLFFLHDGRTSDLLAAIRAHMSVGSEANGVILNFNLHSESDKQDLLNFLRSL
jgi:CxxC motif-containing protein (DUF1111 family)